MASGSTAMLRRAAQDCLCWPTGGGSELAVQAAGEDRYRPAVGIVRRVHHELIIERQDHAIVHVHSVEGLDDGLGAIVELTVADQDPKAARREVGAVIPRQRVDRPGKSDSVVWPSPPCALDGSPQ